MRISTSQIQLLGVNSILEQQSKLSKTQLQVSTGKRVLVPSDDPVATTQMMQLRQSLDTTDQYQTNADTAINRLSLEEGVLDGVTTLLQRVRQQAVQGANGTQTNETRKFIAEEIRQRLDELVGLANTIDGGGDYLFSGGKGSTEPFVRTANGYRYDGDQTQRSIKIGPAREVADADHGARVFQFVRDGNGAFATAPGANAVTLGVNVGTGVIDGGSVVGNFVPSLAGLPANQGYTITFTQVLPTDPVTYTVTDSTGAALVPPVTGVPYVAGEPIELTNQGARVTITGEPSNGDTFTIKSSENKDVFQMLDDLASALEDPVGSPAEGAALKNQLGRALSDLDQAMGNILVVRSSLGSRLNAVESQQYINEGAILQGEETLSSLQDLDYAEAISRLNMQMAGLEAAQQTYMKINGLSMFNYLR